MATIEPMQGGPKPPMSKARKVGLSTAAAGALALSLAVAGLKPDEGKVNYTYLDIVKVPTECYGHVDYKSPVGTKFSDPQCEALLSTDVNVKLRAVEQCTPILADRPYQLAAATRLAFNIGQGNYCKSGAARAFNSGNLKLGCQRFSGWVKAGGKIIKGLVLRRQREIKQCMEGL